MLGDEKLQHRRPKLRREQRLGYRGQRNEAAVGTERSVGGEHMHVQMKVHHVAEGLNEEHQPRPFTGLNRRFAAYSYRTSRIS